MVVDQGLSYAVIARRYGVGYDSVFQSLKAGALKAGDEWPIKRDLTRAVRKGLEEATIDSAWVRESLLEAYEEAQADFIPAVVYVNQRQATLALREPARHPRFHRPGCVYITDTDISIPFEQTRVRKYVPCGTCCRKLSLREWSRTIGIEQSHLSMVMNKKITRIKKSTAIKMMRAIGEEPHASLANWQPYWQERRWRRARAVERAAS
jgi:hypothetical protein